MLGGADNPNGELPSYITGADSLMATTLNQTHPLLTIPFNVDTDFTVLADHCEHFSDAMLECDDTAQRLALCGRLDTYLMFLK